MRIHTWNETRHKIQLSKLLSNSNYWSEGAFHSDVDHRHAKQILHSGLRYLREDIDTLKINLKNRGITLDVDSLVSNVY